MSVPPSFSDLGKAARDIFSKGFNYGVYKVEAKTKTSNGVELTANSSSNHDTKKFIGSLETKYKWSNYGITLTEKWNTDNVLSSEVTIDDQLLKGLKLSFDTQFVPQTGKKSGKIKTEYRRDHIRTNADVDFNFAGPTVVGSSVLGYRGWLTGCQLTLDTSKTAAALVAQRVCALGYCKNDVIYHCTVKDEREFVGTVYHKVSRRLETAVQMEWRAGSNDTKFAVAAKYCPDVDTTLRAKLNSDTQLALCYQNIIHNGVTLTLSTHIEGKHFNQGGHKFGIGLDFDA